MMYVDDVPTSVTINEAVELAKDFGGEDESHRFVNGVLGRIAKMLEGEADPAAVPEPVLDPAVPSPAPCATDDACDSEAPREARGGGAAEQQAVPDHGGAAEQVAPDCESAHGA